MREFFDHMMGVQRLLREAWAASRAPASCVVGHAPQENPSMLTLGETEVCIATETAPAAGPLYLNLHENEQTSVQAARSVLAASQAGSLVQLRSRGRRNVLFRLGARPHVFDPNRIFSDAGINQTLTRYASLTPAAVQALQQLRAALLDRLQPPAGQPVVALHNNSGTDYTIAQYRPGRPYARDAAALAITSTHAPEDFFVVTEESWFQRLKLRGFNVVLQSPGATDDGSLSIWFQRQGRSYINVEARHGRLAEQRAMLRAIEELLAA